MALETFPYDRAELLPDPETICPTLKLELDENEPIFIADALSAVARARGGFTKLSAETGISAEELQQAAVSTDLLDRETILRVMEAFRPDASSTRVA